MTFSGGSEQLAKKEFHVNENPVFHSFQVAVVFDCCKRGFLVSPRERIPCGNETFTNLSEMYLLYVAYVSEKYRVPGYSQLLQ